MPRKKKNNTRFKPVVFTNPKPYFGDFGFNNLMTNTNNTSNLVMTNSASASVVNLNTMVMGASGTYYSGWTVPMPEKTEGEKFRDAVKEASRVPLKMKFSGRKLIVNRKS